MANSLRDQLVAAGLASASQAKKAEKQKKAEAQARRNRSAGKGGGKGKNASGKKTSGSKGKNNASPPAPGSAAAAASEPTSAQRAKQARAARSTRDKALARERNMKAQARALRAQIKQLIAQHDQRVKEKSDTDVPYNFLHKKKIKRIYVPPAQLDALSTGKLVIVNNDGMYNLVTPDIAEKIAQRDPKWIITAHSDAKAEPEMDDYYKKFEVPDDLEW